MSFINSYKAVERTTFDHLFKEPYDINTNIPVPSVLETERVQVVPFIPAVHAEIFYAEYEKHPDLHRYLPEVWENFQSFLALLDFFQRDEAFTLFAIIDKTKAPLSSEIAESKIPNGRIAGIIGGLHISPRNRSLELGPVIILPEFQQTFVSANAIGLVLKYVLDRPSQGGLGYRRVAWAANPMNERSVEAAEKMGFVKEGVLRWTWQLPLGKEGKELDEGERGEGKGRDSVVLSLCWDDWEGGARDVVLKRMERL